MTTIAQSASLQQTAKQDRLYQWIRVALILVALYSLVDFFLRYTIGRTHIPHITSIVGAWKEGLLVLLYALWYARSKQLGFSNGFRTRLHWMILATFAASLISIIGNYLTGGAGSYDVSFATPHWVTVHESLGIAVAALRTLLESSLYFFVLIALIEDEETMLEMANLMIFSGVIMSFYGIYQHYYVKTPASWVYSDAEGSATRVFATLNNPNDLGSFMLMTAPLAISFMIYSKSLRDRILYGIASIILLIDLMYTLSRGAWIGLICGIVLYVLVTKNWKLLIALVVVVGGVAIFAPSLVHRLTLVFSSSYLTKSSQAGRLQFWNRVFQIWMRRPVTGAGLGLVGDTVAVLHKVPGATWIDNQYMKLLGETGILGVVSYVFMLLTPVVKGWKWMSNEKEHGTFRFALNAGLLVAIFGMMVQNFFEGTFETWTISTNFWVMVAMLYASIRLSKKAGTSAN